MSDGEVFCDETFTRFGQELFGNAGVHPDCVARLHND